MKRCVGRQLRLMALTVVFALPASSVELVGTTRATFEWTPSADDVFGYEVYVERNGGPRLNVELVVMPRATVEAQYGDEIIVSVRAVGFLGEKPVYSPFSTRSVSVKFLEPPRFGGDGTLALHCDQCSKVEFHSIADGDVLGDLTVPAGVWQIVDAADVDLDNEADLLWRNADTGALAALMVSEYAFTGGAFSNDATLIDREAVATGDFDGDGVAEFVLQHLVSGDVEYWAIEGDGIDPLAGSAGQPDHLLVAVADFDGDQRPDLLWHNAQSGALRFWRMQGLDAAEVVEIGTQTSPDRVIAGAGDYNGDGNVDVLWRNRYDGSLAIWYLQNGRFSREALLPGVPGDAALEVAGSADFTGVFGEEIVLQHRDTGEVSILFPFSEFSPSRLRIATPGRRWRVVDVAN